MSTPRVIVVTGANRGIGHAICASLVKSHTTSSSTKATPLNLYACSRAGKPLEPSLPESPNVTIHPTKLDITSPESIENLKSTLKSSSTGHIDILINNAGLNILPAKSFADTEKVVRTNYFGTRDVCLSLLPLLKSSSEPRLVNLSSTASGMSSYSSALAQKLRSSHDNLTVSELDDIADQYLKDVKAGFPDSPEIAQYGGQSNNNGYGISKACINALTAILARENPDVIANACCPGWVNTEMGSLVGQPGKTPEEGARIPVHLALDDLDGVSGQYWGNPGVSDTGKGGVRKW